MNRTWSLTHLSGKCLVVLLLLSSFIPSDLEAMLLADARPFQVYRQVDLIQQEVELIKKKLKIHQQFHGTQTEAKLSPRHVWSLTYIILVKINQFRVKLGLPKIGVQSFEPVLETSPQVNYEQTQRILVELALLKGKLGIKGTTHLRKSSPRKSPADVYFKLNQISNELDLIIGDHKVHSIAFAEVVRLFDDTTVVLQKLKLSDPTFPPKKEPSSTPSAALQAARGLFNQIISIKKLAGLPGQPVPKMYQQNLAKPGDVLNLVVLCLVEMQTLKAELGISSLTPVALDPTRKQPADIRQLLEWSTRRLALIKSLNPGEAP